jgi:endonuclease/exonuclease/phosphatase (EEP) superfamily protein YafD
MWYVAKSLAHDDYWLLWMLNANAKFLFLPALALALLSAVRRNWRSLALLSIPAAIFGLLYGQLFLPSYSRVRAPERLSLRVMTFNVLNINTDYHAMTEAILSQDADLVGLQELIPANSSAIEPTLTAEKYPFHTPLPLEHRLEVALFTRYPIISSEKLNLPWNDLSRHAVVAINGLDVHVFVLHLIPTLIGQAPISTWPERITEREKIRMDQIDRVFSALPDEDVPVLLLCDCNFTETTAAYARFASRFQDAFREVGSGLGHTVHPVGITISFSRIDYVWYSHHFVAEAATVASGGMSDHSPVVVDLALVTYQ